jgi:hypothetical protein
MAGHVLHATPQAIQGRTVTFKQEGTGQPVHYPLSVFPPGEQERLRIAWKNAAIPEGLQSAGEFGARILKRSRPLYENGEMSEEEYRKSTETTLAVLRQQAAPLVEHQTLSPERLEIILKELATQPE